MNQAGDALGGVAHSTSNMEGKKNGRIKRQWFSGIQPGAQRRFPALRRLHYPFQHQIKFTAVANPLNPMGTHNVGMVAQLHPHRPLAQEEIAGSPVGQKLRLKRLERHQIVGALIAAEMDQPHTTYLRIDHFITPGN